MECQYTDGPNSISSNIRRPALLAWLRLARVFQKIDRISADEFRSHGLSQAQFDILAHVGSDEGITQQQLADALLVTKGNVCQLIDRMEQTGLLVRRQKGRMNRLFLTERGQELAARVVPKHEDAIVDRFALLNRSEQVELLRLLRKVDQGLSCCKPPRRCSGSTTTRKE